MFKEGKLVSRFAFDENFNEIKEGPYRRTGQELNRFTSEHFNPAVSDPKSSDFVSKSIPDKVCVRMKIDCFERHKMQFVTGQNSEFQCSFCQIYFETYKKFLCNSCNYFYCVYCASEESMHQQ